jgi:hypothetical protein
MFGHVAKFVKKKKKNVLLIIPYYLTSHVPLSE